MLIYLDSLCIKIISNPEKLKINFKINLIFSSDTLRTIAVNKNLVNLLI